VAWAISFFSIREPENQAVCFGHPRPFLLSHFCISAPFRELTLWDRLMCSVAPSKKPVTGFARFASRTVVYRQRYLEDGTYVPELHFPRSTNYLYILGDYQAFQYARDMEEVLRAEFCFREPATGKNLNVLEEILSAEVSVSIHVRRGDYANVFNGERLLSADYYMRAITAILERGGQPTFFVFSDDIAFARELLPKGYRMVFVDHNDETKPHEDLRLMSACRHNIIANSTLSWWGAWLNPNPEKLICVPGSWQNSDPGFSYADLVPPNWHRISTAAPSA
jgi:hypothetical protein